MIHFQNNQNLFYFNTTDLTNNCLYIQDQSEYGFVDPKTILSVCQVTFDPNKVDENAYTYVQNTRYIAISQDTISSNKYNIQLISSVSSNKLHATIQYSNQRNCIDFSQFVNSNYIQQNKIYTVLLRDLQQSSSSSTTSSSNLEYATVKVYQFNSNDFNANNQLILTYNALGLESSTNISISDINGNIVGNDVISYYWSSLGLILTNKLVTSSTSSDSSSSYFSSSDSTNSNSSYVYAYRLTYVVVQNSTQEDTANIDGQYYPATKIKLNQISDNEKANYVIDTLLNPSIIEYRQLRIYNEIAVRLDEHTYKVTYQNLLDDNTQIFMNRSKYPLSPSQYTINYAYGTIKFNFSTTVQDSFQVTYSFDYFPSHLLYGFLQRAVSEINVGPVGTPTSYTFSTAPQFYNGLIANYAYVFCLDKMIMDYDIWKGRLIFAIGPQNLADGGGDIISQLESLRSNAWQRINNTLNNTKLKAPETLAYPTQAYFDGISPLGRYSGASGHGFNGGKLRGLKINRYGGSF